MKVQPPVLLWLNTESADHTAPASLKKRDNLEPILCCSDIPMMLFSRSNRYVNLTEAERANF